MAYIAFCKDKSCRAVIFDVTTEQEIGQRPRDVMCPKCGANYRLAYQELYGFAFDDDLEFSLRFEGEGEGNVLKTFIRVPEGIRVIA